MTSDTEALLHLYARHSAEMAHRLRGMFAFAIWDERQRGLLLVPGPGMEAAIVWYQPNGRRHRRFQLGAVGQDASTRHDALGLDGARGAVASRWSVLLSSSWTEPSRTCREQIQ